MLSELNHEKKDKMSDNIPGGIFYGFHKKTFRFPMHHVNMIPMLIMHFSHQMKFHRLQEKEKDLKYYSVFMMVYKTKFCFRK